MMNRWQHFLHIFNIHDWHTLEEWEAEVFEEGHGKYVGKISHMELLIKKICCHCGVEKTATWRKWIGF